MQIKTIPHDKGGVLIPDKPGGQRRLRPRLLIVVDHRNGTCQRPARPGELRRGRRE